MDLRETLSTFEGFIGRGEIDGFCELSWKRFLTRGHEFLSDAFLGFREVYLFTNYRFSDIQQSWNLKLLLRLVFFWKFYN